MNRPRFTTVSSSPAARAVTAATFIWVALAGLATAHHPDKENQPVHPRIDLIGPIGNRLPPSYRRTYNRPTKLGGRIAYWIAPSSQEAMAWHHAKHAGAYKAPKKHLRLEQHYFYPKPWEVLRVGPRPSDVPPDDTAQTQLDDLIETLETETIQPGNSETLDPGTIEPVEIEIPAQREDELELPDLNLPSLNDQSHDDVQLDSPSDLTATPIKNAPAIRLAAAPISADVVQIKGVSSKRALVSRDDVSRSCCSSPSANH
ncbi:hypothetical protein NHH03_09400 [Stieleria sp. TO1_6]|uniref:hypothetical protein n=1 Tax=Stieleria tagensis TaxID=2956795 RepID=UPI00209ACECC|nr:hypothetical protein [Stieleria tagensis]MCO8121950.1 hypothetical protein [Stieleria tagensis]